MDLGGRLNVSLVGAKGLRAADWGFRGGSSDPFCTAQIVGKPATSVKTAHKSKTLTPVWNEDFIMEDYEAGDDIELSVWDHDMMGSPDLLGKTVLPASAFSAGGFDGELPLQETGKATSTVQVRISAPVFPQPLSPAPPISEPGSRLIVKIISARGLRAADFSMRGKGSSDPFCRCQVIGKPDSEVETNHISKSLSPEWNEEHEVDEYVQGDTLEFEVFDYDKGSAADLLGKVQLTHDVFDRQGGFQGDLKLLECGDGHSAKLLVNIQILPPRRRPAPPVWVPGGRLQVTMLSAKGLRAADFSLIGKGASDPFCTCQIVGKDDSLIETKHIAKTLEPEWNEEDIIEEYQPGDSLIFRVYDYDRGSSADLLGRAVLPFHEFDRHDGFEGELRLKECGKGHRATLRVRIVVLPPERPDAPPVWNPGCRLQVKLISARGLRAADFSLMGKGASDPFCSCEVVGKDETFYETKHIDKTLEPMWNEEYVMEDYVHGDSLSLRVMDYDRGSSADLLGRAVLACREFDREGGYIGEVRLKEAGKGHKAYLKLQVNVLPPKRAPAPPVSEKGSKLKIMVLGATGLRAADWSLMGKGASDPFCSVQVAGKDDSLVQTRHIDKTLSPEWNEEFILDEYERGDSLEFRVMDHDKGSAADLLGRVALKFGEFDREDGFDDEVKLRECGKGFKPYLRLRITVLPPRPWAPPVAVKGSRLQITAVSAKGLRAADWSLMGGGKSDPFCTVELEGKEDSLVQTAHIAKTLEPVWNEGLEIDEYEHGDVLVFSVLDYDRGSSADLLGRCRLVCDEFDREDGFDGVLKLKECGASNAGRSTITVRVAVLPPKRPPAPPVSVPGGRLKVSILSARGLRAADFSLIGKGKSDPFCSLQVVGKEDSLVETRHIEKTLEPEWNEEFEVDEYTRGDSLEFRVMDWDRGSSADLLGRIVLPCDEFDRADGFDDEVKLKEAGKGHKALLRLRIAVLPPKREPAPPVALPGARLKVTMVSAQGLRAADWSLMGGGKSDPYCTLQISDKPETLVQTKHINKTLEPVWNEEFVLEDYESGDSLEFNVMDYDRVGSADLLGRITLPSHEFDRADGFDDDVKLKDAGKGGKARLRLKVEVLPPLPSAPAISEPGSRISVIVLGARGLRAADWSLMGGKSDPYCRCLVSGKPDSMAETRHINKTLEPDWNEELIIEEYDTGEALEFTVLDRDKITKDDLLGRARLLAKKFDHELGFEGELPLRDSGKGKAVLRVQVKVLPPLTKAMPRVSEPGSRLLVHVMSAAGLRAADFSIVGGKSDPYCEYRLLGRTELPYQTLRIKGTLDPDWNECAEFTDYVFGEALEFRVWDHDVGSAPDLLGRVKLAAREFDREGGFNGTLALRQCGPGHHSTLRLKAEVLLPSDSQPLMVSVGKAFGLPGAREAEESGEGLALAFEVPNRPRSRARTSAGRPALLPEAGEGAEADAGGEGGFALEWAEEKHLLSFVPGDILKVSVMAGSNSSVVVATGALPSNSVMDNEGGFFGTLALMTPANADGGEGGATAGSLHFRAETKLQFSERKKREAEERRRQQEEERRRQEEEERRLAEEERLRILAEEERLRKEEERRRLEEQREAERKAHEEVVRRDRNKTIRVTVRLTPGGHVLPVLNMKGKDTVADTQDLAIKLGKLPLRPRFLDPTGKIKFEETHRSLADLMVPDGYEVVGEVYAILTASKDKTARIWNAGTGENVLTMRGHEGAVNTVVATPDLKFALTSSDDETAKVWAIDRWQGIARPMFTLRGHEGPVVTAVFSDNGLLIATGGADSSVKIWAMRTGQCLLTLDAHTGPLVSVAFESDDTRVRSVARDNPRPTRKLFETENGVVCHSEKVTLPPATERPKVTLTSPCGKRRIPPPAGAWELQVLEVETGERLMFLEGHQGEVLSASYVALRPPALPGGNTGSETAPQDTLPEVDTTTTRRNDPEAKRLSETVCGRDPTTRYIRPQRRHGGGHRASQAAPPQFP